jgi:hypothetical protein
MVYDFYFADKRLAAEARAEAEAEDDEDDEDDENDEEDEEDVPEDDNDSEARDEEEGSNPGSGTDSRNKEQPRVRPSISGYKIIEKSDVVNVQHSRYPDELVVDPRGNLYSTLPGLSCASRQSLAETWHYNFNADYKFLVHVNYYRTQPFFERQGVIGLLTDLCGITVTETNTTVVLHGINAYDRPDDGVENAKDNLKWWLRKYWYDAYPLFDTNLEVMFKHASTLNGRLSFGDHRVHPMRQLKAEYHRTCFGIVKYLRFLHDADATKWRQLALSILRQWDELEYNCAIPPGRGSKRLPPGPHTWCVKWPIVEPPAKQYTDLVEPVFDLVAAVIGPGAEVYREFWQWAVHKLALNSFERAKLAVNQALGERSVAIEEGHARKALPELD